MIRFDDLQVFIHAADLGSFSAAARELDQTPAVASAAVKRLEQHLGVRLFVRSTRSLRLTPDGLRYQDYARSVLATLDAGQHALEQDKHRFSGQITLSMPSDLGRNLLLDWLDRFQNQHPQLNLQIRISDRLADLVRQPVDAALRYGIPPDSSLVAIALAPDNRRVLCASPDYFARHGRPQHPEELKQHNCLRMILGNALHERWRFFDGDRECSVAISGNRVSDDGDLVRRWALAGEGLAYKSRLDVARDLQSGRLQSALDDYRSEASPLYLVVAHRQLLSPAIHAIGAWMQQQFQAYLDESGHEKSPG